jgi:hypothetical protein
MKDNHLIRSVLPFSLVKTLEIRKQVVSLTIARCLSSLKELENIWWFTNLKSLVIHDYCSEVYIFEAIMTHHKKIQKLTALEKFEIYSNVFNCNPFSSLKFIPPTITSLTLHYDALMTERSYIADKKTLFSSFLNVKYLHLYATETEVLIEELHNVFDEFSNDDQCNLVLPKLESIESTFKSELDYVYSSAFTKILKANENTIKKVRLNLNDFSKLIFIAHALIKVEEFTMDTENTGNVEAHTQTFLMSIIKRMKNLRKLSFICDETPGWSETLVKLALVAIQPSSPLPHLHTVSCLFPFTIYICDSYLFHYSLSRIYDKAANFFNSYLESYRDLVSNPFDLLTLVTEDGPFSTIGPFPGTHLRGHFLLDVGKLRKLL